MEPDDEFNTKSGGCEDMNTAQVIPFQKPPQPKQEAGKSMYSDKFVQGYVMSSRLYRKEVWPFLSDAARNVYAELENRINGHNKESDFVSYSQLQGGDLEGSRQLGRKTVSFGIKELIELGVVSIVESGKQGVKKYRLNDISLKDRFTKETSSLTTPVHKQNQDRFTKETKTGSPSELTIDNKNLLDIKKRTSSVDNSETEIFSDSVEYHSDNKNLYNKGISSRTCLQLQRTCIQWCLDLLTSCTGCTKLTSSESGLYRNSSPLSAPDRISLTGSY